MKRNPLFVLLAVFFLMNAKPVFAGEAEMMSMIQRLQKQMMQMQTVIDSQSQRLSQIEKQFVILAVET